MGASKGRHLTSEEIVAFCDAHSTIPIPEKKRMLSHLDQCDACNDRYLEFHDSIHPPNSGPGRDVSDDSDVIYNISVPLTKYDFATVRGKIKILPSSDKQGPNSSPKRFPLLKENKNGLFEFKMGKFYEISFEPRNLKKTQNCVVMASLLAPDGTVKVVCPPKLPECAEAKSYFKIKIPTKQSWAGKEGELHIFQSTSALSFFNDENNFQSLYIFLKTFAENTKSFEEDKLRIHTRKILFV
jgi:hypothetical protein